MFDENPLIYTQVIIHKRKYGWTDVWQMNVQIDGQNDNQSET